MSNFKRKPLIDSTLTICITQFTLPRFKATSSKIQALLLLREQLITNFQVLVEEYEILRNSLFKFVQCIGDRFTP